MFNLFFIGVVVGGIGVVLVDKVVEFFANVQNTKRELYSTKVERDDAKKAYNSMHSSYWVLRNQLLDLPVPIKTQIVNRLDNNEFKKLEFNYAGVSYALLVNDLKNSIPKTTKSKK